MTNILIVEDEVIVRTALMAQIRSIGSIIDSRSAVDAEKKLKAAREKDKPIDLAIIDLQLPDKLGMNSDAGFTLVGLIEQLYPNTPVIVLTVRNDPESHLITKKHKAIKFYVTKPWSSRDLKSAVKQCLDGTAIDLAVYGMVESTNGL